MKEIKDNIWKEAEKDVIFHNINGKEKLSIAESCVDRHASEIPNKLAFVFEFENEHIVNYTYKELQVEINKFANYLDKIGIKKRARVFIFLPKIPETYISFLAVLKHGSISAPLFEAFQTDGLELRLERGDADVLITNKELAERLHHKPNTMKIIIIDSPEFKNEIKKMSDKFDAVLLDKDDTMIMMFTSSTAGTPVAGIETPNYALVQQHYSAKLVLDLKKEDRYFCTAHPGWVTGAIYGIIAPLSIGCTNYVYVSHFDAKHWINFIKKNKISVIYTAPTALRLLRSEIKKDDLKLIRNLCSVGEALTGTVFEDYKKLGVLINDTYWQTETGAMVIANWRELRKKKNSIGKALPGINAAIKDGVIVLKPGWPAMMTGIYKHEQMYKDYFKDGYFITNDLAKQDKEGYFFFIGRKDDIIKVSGERISPIEVESFLMKHRAVREAAVIGIPDAIKGSVLKAFIVLNKDFENKGDDKLKNELMDFVKQNYAGHSYPKVIEFVSNLPKTNSGKIIRMKLREMERK